MKRIHTALLAATLGTALLSGCELPNQESTQTAYRGLAMGQVINPRVVKPIQDPQVAPDPLPPMPDLPGAPLAKDSFKNVKVLGDLTANEFTRTMLAITAWVSPTQGCTYCHNPGEDLSADTLYTKVVARRMLELTRNVNYNWQGHVANTGVTCYTCHRGQPVPTNIWFLDKGPRQAKGGTSNAGGQNHPSEVAGLTAMGIEPLAPYLLGNTPLRVAGLTALPTSKTPAGIQQTEGTFALMIHISKSLGVNCTHCHNTRSHSIWAESPKQRNVAYDAIRMARELNNSYMVPLTASFPANRLGPTGDVPKINCATCHQGINKPLKGAPMAKDYPGLAAPAKPATMMAAAAPATAEPAAAPAPAAAASR